MSDHGHENKFRFVSTTRRTQEDRRFIIGRGRFVGDMKLPDTADVAMVPSPYAHARILSIDTSKAKQHPGVIMVVTGEDLVRDIDSMPIYLDTPKVKYYPLAVGKTRFAGEWVAAVVATDRYTAEDAAELIEVEYEPLPAINDPEQAMQPGSPLLYEAHESNVMLHKTFTWGPVDADFARADFTVSRRLRWHRHSGVPIETFGVQAYWDPGKEILEVWSSIQMPQYPDQIAAILKLRSNQVRVHYEVDVGGSYGTKRGIKHSILIGYMALRAGCPVRFIEDRMEYMRAGGCHGPDRVFYAEAAATNEGRIISMKIRTIDDNGAFPGRSPMQMAKPVTAIVGPYQIESVWYEAIAVSTNKTEQIAFRGFGQAPQNFVVERLIDLVADHLQMDPVEVRKRNLIQPEQFPYTIPSGTTYDSGDYPTVMQLALDSAGYAALRVQQAKARAEGRLVGIGVAGCVEPAGGNALFLPLFNPKNQVTTFPEGVMVKIDRNGNVTAAISFPSSGQGHETMVSTVVGEELGIDPAKIRVIHYDTLAGLPTQSPVASRMAIVAGNAVAKAARKLKEKMIRIAAHNLRRPSADLVYQDGDVVSTTMPSIRMAFADLIEVAHRRFHLMPIDEEPGLQALHVEQVPTGGVLPTPDGKVQMYPCYSFSTHVALVEVDPDTGIVKIPKYHVAHDCGTVINPAIVNGMVLGGVGHGIGAALYEEFVYDGETGQFLTQTFADYLLPSTLEMPHVELVEHCTPSPLTVLGQKGVGEGGYMTAPAAVASAVNDALRPLGVDVNEIPMTPDRIRQWVKAARAASAKA